MKQKKHSEVPWVQKVRSCSMLFLTWTVQWLESIKQIQKQDQVWFNRKLTHKGVGTVQSKLNPLKNGSEVTAPLYEILHMFQDRFQRRSDLTTFWSRTRTIFIVQPRSSCDIHLIKPRCKSDCSSTWTQMKIMMNTTTILSILKNTITFWSIPWLPIISSESWWVPRHVAQDHWSFSNGYKGSRTL